MDPINDPSSRDPFGPVGLLLGYAIAIVAVAILAYAAISSMH